MEQKISLNLKNYKTLVEITKLKSLYQYLVKTIMAFIKYI